MPLIFRYKKLQYGFNPPGVYKMIFDTGHFYIGSGNKVKTRIKCWRARLKRMDFGNKIILDILPTVKEVTFEIIEVTTKEKRLDMETFHIHENESNPLLMNRCPTAYGQTGIKPLPAHLQPIRQPKKMRIRKGKFKPDNSYVWPNSKAVHQFDLNGKFIMVHKSIAEAIKHIGVSWKTMSKHLKKSTFVFGIKGYVFRKDGGVQNFTIVKKQKL